ncbi:MAG: hypothetical protein V4692_04530 [Bdellovibrionota bacterium]
MFRSTIRSSYFAFNCLFAVATIASSFVASEAHAQSAAIPLIFDVRRSLPLEPNEPVYHDFYINAGPEVGFKKGSFVSVVRAIPIHDPLQNTHQATLNIRIGRLEIIHTEKNITVGRLHDELTDDERPTVEFEAVMIGDRVDMASLTNEAPAKKKKKAAQVEAAPAVHAAVVTVSEPVVSAPAPVAPSVPQQADSSAGQVTPKAPPVVLPERKAGDPSAATPSQPSSPETLPQSLPSTVSPV